MSASIPLIIISTGLATALAVGAYQHYETVGAIQDQISELEVATQKPLTFAEMDELKSMFIGETSKSAPNQGQDGSAPDNWIYGNTKARFTLVEMTDTECPYCKQHFPVIKSLIDSSGGHINAALMHVPALSEASRQQALAIECAGEQGGSETAWKFAQRVFDTTRGNGQGVAASLSSYAAEMDIDRQRFSQCMDSSQVVERVIADMDHAIRLDIKQTPSTMVIDNLTGNSIVLQGDNSSHKGILDAMEQVSKTGAAQ